METIKVGIREFRSHLPHYLLEVGQPVAITRHGETVGYYIPSRDKEDNRDVDALKAAASKLDILLRDAGIETSELADEFVSLRHTPNR
jgi:PHD/YefM family antitoxin component YafN of YafNO toxin-antitoxin module